MGERSQKALERLDEGPVYTVYLDAGSFNWLYEQLQAKTRFQIWLKPYQRLVKRTLLSFDEARRTVEKESGVRPAKKVLSRVPVKKAPSRSRKR